MGDYRARPGVDGHAELADLDLRRAALFAETPTRGSRSLERVTGNHVDFSFVATVLLKDGISWLLVPGAALFVGGVLADILFGRRLWSQDAAIG